MTEKTIEKEEQKKLKEYHKMLEPHFEALKKKLLEHDWNYYERANKNELSELDDELANIVITYGIENNLADRDLGTLSRNLLVTLTTSLQRLGQRVEFMKEDLIMGLTKVPFNKLPFGDLDKILKELDNKNK